MLLPMHSLTFYQLPAKPQALALPLLGCYLPAGFASPADDYLDGHLDLNQYLIRHQAATYFARVRGDSMQDAGIQDGDLIVIDRALKPCSGQVVVAVVEGEFTVKRLRLVREQVWLEPANEKYQPMEIKSGMSFSVRGVVTHVIHSMGATAGVRVGNGGQITAE